MRAATPESADVLVVGAGPVGMLAALALAERGASVRIVDRYRRAALHSYALALHPGSLRLLDEYGLAETLCERGHKLDRVELLAGPGRTASINLSAVGGTFPFVLVLPQSLLESALEERLENAGVPVQWGHPLLTFDDERDAVTALIGEVTGEPGGEGAVITSRVRASYVIGADGSDSLARRLLPSSLHETGPTLSYGLIEFEGPLEAPERMTLVFGETTTDVLWPLGAERARWGVELADGAGDIEVRALWDLVRERAPAFDPGRCHTEWATRVAFRPGLATSFGRGRVWIAGDAGHSTSPVGVQSMNVGLREGHDLARRLTAILRGTREPKLLRYYHEDREREWKMLLGVHDRLRLLPAAPDWIRGIGQRLVRSLPASGQDLNFLLEQVGLRLAWLRGRGGKGG